MSTEHEGVDRSPQAGRADDGAAADRVPPVASQDASGGAHEASRDDVPAADSTTELRKVDPTAEPPAAPAEPPRYEPERPATGEHPTAQYSTGHPTAQHGHGTPPGTPPAPGGPPPAGPYTGAYGAAPYGGAGAHGGADHGGHAGGPPPGGHHQPWGAPMPPPPPRKRRGGLIAAGLAAALVVGATGGGVGFWAADQRSDSSPSETVSSRNDETTLTRAPDSVAGIADKALPSTVTIQANGGSGEAGGGTGTGFVFDKQGHILTNNHVVAGAAGDGGELTLVFSDGKKYPAEVVGRAQGYDVAVLKLKNPEDTTLTPLPLGSSDEVAVGDSTIAIGAPFGLSGTVTTGIVSALNRPVASSDGEGSQSSYMSALQTDASINPGNSGGPLLNSKGAVIGINSAIQSASGGGFGGGSAGSIGLGFAIPIDQAKRVAQNLIETGEPVYPIIGATVGLEEQGAGAQISPEAVDGTPAVVPNGPADKAGLEAGDVITKLDGTVVDSGPTLISEIWTHEPGDQVEIEFERDGQKQTAQLTLGERRGDG